VTRNAPPPLPEGSEVVLDRTVRRLPDGGLVGGSPRRVVRLSADGRAAYAEVVAGAVRSPAARSLARYLTDAGLAHPRPVPLPALDLATVVIPVHDRAESLERCLGSIGDSLPVLVVDDGSADATAVEKVVAQYGVRLIRRDLCGGPAAARNTAIAAVQTEYVVMIDSDCVAPPGWVDQLAGHLADPTVALVAPRIVPLSVAGSARRYAAVHGSLDLGDRPALVAPLTRVSYVPSTALVARRTALLDVAVDGAVFDETLRYGEDVDLVWRLHAAGWRVRYEPLVKVQHDEPSTWPALLRRRSRYGSSAAALSQRHPGATQPLAVPILPAAAVAAAVAGRPRVAAAAAIASWVAARRVRAAAGLPADGTTMDTSRALVQTWIGTGRYAAQFFAPVALAAVAGGSRRSRATVAALLAAPSLATLTTARATLDPPRLVLGSLADDVAYGAGVWAGCLRERTIRPVRPVIRGWRPTPLPPTDSAKAK
jgi:mycofactocin system glycosyltransferase